MFPGLWVGMAIFLGCDELVSLPPLWVKQSTHYSYLSSIRSVRSEVSCGVFFVYDSPLVPPFVPLIPLPYFTSRRELDMALDLYEFIFSQVGALIRLLAFSPHLP